jgi:hypothetical protein
MLVIRLIEEHILSILILGCIRFQDTIRGDTVLSAELFPEFVTNYSTKEN